MVIINYIFPVEVLLLVLVQIYYIIRVTEI